MLTNEQQRILSGMSKEEKAVVDAIMLANSMDEKGLIDSIIKDVNERRSRLFDVIYVDLSIDRSTRPLEITGAGTLLAAVEASDNNAAVTLSFEVQDQATESRIEFKRGKRMYAPYSRIYIYHAAQSGKYMKILRGFGTRSVFLGFEDDSGESANSDLVVALGNSSVISTGQVNVPTTAGGTVIKAANTSRKRITLKVPETATEAVFIGNTGLTASNGHRLGPGDAIVLNTTAAIYGITATGTVNGVSYLEE